MNERSPSPGKPLACRAGACVAAGRGGHYTQCNPPERIVYTESLATRSAAEGRERQLKGWTRRKKEALIAGNLQQLKAL